MGEFGRKFERKVIIVGAAGLFVACNVQNILEDMRSKVVKQWYE